MNDNDYIDTVVLTEESQVAEAATKHPIGQHPIGQRPIGSDRNIPTVNDVRLTRVGSLEVTKLTIDESSDGGDPYNSTGKHCVLKRIEE
jgi:hypothetical protein